MTPRMLLGEWKPDYVEGQTSALHPQHAVGPVTGTRRTAVRFNQDDAVPTELSGQNSDRRCPPRRNHSRDPAFAFASVARILRGPISESIRGPQPCQRDHRV